MQEMFHVTKYNDDITAMKTKLEKVDENLATLQEAYTQKLRKGFRMTYKPLMGSIKEMNEKYTECCSNLNAVYAKYLPKLKGNGVKTEKFNSTVKIWELKIERVYKRYYDVVEKLKEVLIKFDNKVDSLTNTVKVVDEELLDLYFVIRNVIKRAKCPDSRIFATALENDLK